VEEVARLLPQYEILAMIGHGGMGAVYKGRQEALDRLVAIKLLPLEISVDATFAERFRREARAMARLSHPNIVPVYDFGQTSEGHLFFVMEFVDGRCCTISSIRNPRSRKVPRWGGGAGCEALAYAHVQGVVHRDIKPANVLVARDGG
jgi:serine/threonine protein kinase